MTRSIELAIFGAIGLIGSSICEYLLGRCKHEIGISTAQFTNVVFSDGSLLHGFEQMIKKTQPIFAPSDIKRFFITSKESWQLCFLSCLYGNNAMYFFQRSQMNSD